MFSMQSVSKIPFIATFQLSSAASLNLGWSQNGVLGNGLRALIDEKLNYKSCLLWGRNHCEKEKKVDTCRMFSFSNHIIYGCLPHCS